MIDPASQGTLVGAKPPSAAFSPSDISGLKCWLRAEAETGFSDGDPVAQWTDQSGNGNHGTQSTEANKPLWKDNIVNGKAVIRFDGSNDYFSLPDFVSGFSAANVFIVVKIDNDPPGAPAQTGFWDLGPDVAGDGTHWPYTDGTIYDDCMTTVRRTVGNPTPALTSWRLYEVISTSSEWTCNLDTSQLYTTGTNTVGGITTPVLGKNEVAMYIDGDIAEFLVYDNKLSAEDRSSLETYFDDEYALSY